MVNIYPVTVDTPCCIKNLVIKTHLKSCSEIKLIKIDSEFISRLTDYDYLVVYRRNLVYLINNTEV